MLVTGKKPGVGRYVCVNCNQSVVLDNNTDTLPPCPKCSETFFAPDKREYAPFRPSFDIYYNIMVKRSKLLLNVKGDAPNPKGAPIIQWPKRGGNNEKFQLIDNQDGWVKIKTKVKDWLFNVKGDAPNQKGAPIIQWPERNGDNEIFKITSLADDWVAIKTKHKDWLLNVKGDAPKPKGAPLIQWPKGSKYDDNEIFKFCPVISEWRAFPAGIEYTNLDDPIPSSQVEIMSSRQWRNDSPATITESLEHSLTRKSSFEWSFTQTFTTQVSTSFEADIPFIGGADVECSFSVDLSSTQAYRKEIELQFINRREIKLDSRSAIQVRGWIDWVDDLKLNFIFKVWVEALAEGINGLGPRLTTNELKNALIADGFEGMILDDSVPHRLLIGLPGVFRGSYGVKTHIDVNEVPLNV